MYLDAIAPPSPPKAISGATKSLFYLKNTFGIMWKKYNGLCYNSRTFLLPSV